MRTHSPIYTGMILRAGIIASLLLIIGRIASAQPDAAGMNALGVAPPIASEMPGSGGIRLVANLGQVLDTRGEPRPDILFTAASRGMRIFFRRDGISYVFSRWTPDEERRSDAPADERLRMLDRGPHGTYETVRMDMVLVGANPRAVVTGEEKLSDHSTYYLPGRADGITDVPSFARVTYRDIYPHIDLTIYSTDGHLKYDMVVHPGGRVSDIRWRYDGEAGAAIERDGSLEAKSALGTLTEARPVAYQGSAPVSCTYMADGALFRYRAGTYDRSRPLVIDPALQWATYAGGSGIDSVGGVAIDSAGNVVVAGTSMAGNFPVTPGVPFPSRSPGADMVLFKLTPAGQLVWSTYCGGGGPAKSLARDPFGNFFLVGNPGGASSGVVTVKLDKAGRRIWTQTLPSTSNVYGVAADPQGNAIVVGTTFNAAFPLVQPIQTTLQGFIDGFITKYSPAGAILFSTYYGGNNFDEMLGVATNAAGDFAVCGYSWSDDMAMFGNTFKLRNPARGATADAVLCVFSAANIPIWSTFYGAATYGLSHGTAVAFDSSGSVILAGETASHDIPLNGGAAQGAHSPPDPDDDAYVAKFDFAGNFLWATYCGGIGNETVGAVVVSPGGDIFVAGTSAASDFPTTAGAYQRNRRGQTDATLIQLDSNGTRFKWASFYGGLLAESRGRLAYDTRRLYLAGTTVSTDLPGTTNGFQPNSAGAEDIFVTRFDVECPTIKPLVSPIGTFTICEGDSIVLATPKFYRRYVWAPFSDTGSRIVAKRSGAYTVTAFNADGCSGTSIVVNVVVTPKPAVTITPGGTRTICEGDSILLSAARPGLVRFTWSTGDTLDHIWVKDTGLYSVRVVDTNGCTNESRPDTIRVNARPSAPLLSAADTVWLCPDSALRLDAGAGYTTYRWSPGGERGRTIQIGAAGLYYVEVTNTSGCAIRSDSVVVITYPRVPVALVVEGSTTFCAGDSVTLRVPPGAFTSPRWSDGSRGDSVVVRSSGTYFVTAIDSNGCPERSNSVPVIVHPKIQSAIAGPSSICANALAIYGTGAKGSLRYAWSVAGDGAIQGASNADTVSVRWGATGSGTITLVVTDTVTGCGATERVDVTIGTSLKPSIAARAQVICAGDSIELDAGGGYSSYLWSTGATTRTIWVRDSAAYAVSVADASGCRGTSDSVRFAVEDLSSLAIAGSAKVCVASTVPYTVGGPPGATYLWTVTGGTIAAGQGTPGITALWGNGASGIVEVAITSAAGCTGTIRTSIEIGNQLKPAVSPAGSLTLCAGDSIVLDAGPGYISYLWSTGATTRTIAIRTGGAYTVTVADASGCGGTSDPVLVTLRTPAPAAITPAGPITLQSGDSAVLDAGAGWIAYSWTLGPVSGTSIGTGRTIVAHASGDYTVTVTDRAGCRATATVSVGVGEIPASAELALDTVEAAPGAPVKVPLRLLASSNLDAAGATAYQARVRYRTSTLVPAGATRSVAIAGDDRIVSFNGRRPAGMTSGLLGTLDLVAALGDTLATPLALEGVTWSGDDGKARPVATVLHPGAFTLIGYCPNGGPRLATTGDAARLKAVLPNPAGGIVRIDYDLLEDGPTRLAVVDLLGRDVAVLSSGPRIHGSHSESFDAATLPGGVYMIVLQTPTARASAFLDVIR